jgi:LuxR family maltose regulon positive regulatory protein
MSEPILATKLYMPAPRFRVVPRPRLIERLDARLEGKLTLISAAAGFGKTTLVSTWVVGCGLPVAWLSLDEGDSDPTRFLVYLIAALQTVAPQVGQGALAALLAPQPPPPEAILTAVLNDIAGLPDRFLLVLDDYHAVDAPMVDQALVFLLQHLPSQMHLVIATREDPPLPLARLRARGQLAELRAADLRFTPNEAAEFLNQVMGLNLSEAEIAALEARTEGWIAGLHLAALSMQGRTDMAGFVAAFSGSHRFVLDYLVEEVLQRQPAGVQDFLLRTAILDRLCGPLCDAVLQDAATAGQATLVALERANLFIVPLDNERRWYRYHHLFGELLRQRLQQQLPADAIAGLHIRASIWCEANDLEMEAFQHAAAAQDIDCAERLLEGRGMPLLFRGAARPILNWLASLRVTALDAHPSLWVTYASALLFISQVAGVEEKLQAAEAALRDVEPDDNIRDLIGHIASIRATVAVTQHDADAIIAQSQRALAYLHPGNLPVRTAATWSLAYAHQLQGDRAAARRGYTEALAASQPIGHFIIVLMSTLGLGSTQEADNQLHLAAETYHRVLDLAGDPPLPVACDAHLGLARINYASNDLAHAEQHAQQALHLARQIPYTDRAVACELFLARLKLAQGDAVGAATLLAASAQQARQHGFALQLPEVAALETLLALRRGPLASTAEPFSERELEVLQLIAQGLSNQEIGKRLFLALDTVKGHNRRIFDKLEVQRRTEAVARARELGLL